MDKNITIIDKDYSQWVKELVARYRQSQIKAAIKVNQELLQFYWELGKDIVERDAENQYGRKFYASLSRDLKEALQTDGFSERNLRYMRSFYLLYNERVKILPQLVANSDSTIVPQDVAELFMVPWGHHRCIIDKCCGNPEKALDFSDVGQLGGYVVACNHTLRREGRDNPTIGLLVCKEKDRIQAQYALESSSQPIGISEYDLEKFYPEKVEGTIPTIEEIEEKLSNDNK